jgi:kinesin family protein 2/24
MDAFYLKNRVVYQKLVDSLDFTQPAPHFSRHEVQATPLEEDQNTAKCNPDIIIGARIRPMLNTDIAAGFPCAVYPRSMEDDAAQIIDLHDLYHHPTRPPMLKVRTQWQELSTNS